MACQFLDLFTTIDLALNLTSSTYFSVSTLNFFILTEIHNLSFKHTIL